MRDPRVTRLMEVAGCNEDTAYGWLHFLAEFGPTRDELQRLVNESELVESEPVSVAWANGILPGSELESR